MLMHFNMVLIPFYYKLLLFHDLWDWLSHLLDDRSILLQTLLLLRDALLDHSQFRVLLRFSLV